ncbi:sulfite reductase [Desulfocucumis palustris]|uniref:Sulfite reductase n=1 Tax=Desulfocucumis palustris TaxID=1898651 RepID=A0A2L2XCW8_9FIRM|nr:NAD(P)/FAD-dependent oxidoreductase [Desulfocucumis palustris]GBF33563.1 sulfite reductase [Desulfocucumis palustris]
MDRAQEMTSQTDSRYRHNSTDRDMLDKGAILQRDGTYAIAPHIPGGVIMDFNLLRKIADVAEKYKCAAVKATSSQRLAIVGLKKEDVDSAWRELGIAPGAAIGLCVRSVKFCPGTTFCKRGQQDAVGLGMSIDKKYHGMTLPSKFKISVSGCPNKCMDAAVIDFGVMGTSKGFTVYVGGNGGVTPRFGQKLVEEATSDQVMGILDRCIDYYKSQARTNERLGKFIDRVGFDAFRENVLQQAAVH